MEIKNIMLLAVGIFLMQLSVYAQQRDTAYYISYERQITGRYYFSRKFTTLQLQNREDYYSLNYRPNTTLNMGVGATYKWATLNLAYGFGFLNPNEQKGKTRYLDLQFHNYSRKYIIDVFGQFYRGFYLSPRGKATNDNTYYRRADLRVNVAGASVQYILNHRKFSYRASFLQNEWQKRSAGTFLVGAEAYAGSVRADSSLVPTAINNTPYDMNRLRFFDIGISGGYAYTRVIQRHFFLTGSGTISLDYGSSSWLGSDKITTRGMLPNTFFRVSGGYNSAKWAMSILYLSDNIRLASSGVARQVVLATSNYRINFVYRFVPGRKAKKVLKAVDEAPLEISK